jgi:small GTP-binding protein
MLGPAAANQYKIVLLGESRVGKTSIIYHEVHGSPPDNQLSTIGCEATAFDLEIDNQTVSLNIWDTAGQEIYRSLVPIYIRGARIVIVVFDVTDPRSFTRVKEWFQLVSDCLPPHTPIILVANKIDLHDSIAVSDDAIDSVARDARVKCFKTSTVTGVGIRELFEYAARLVLPQVPPSPMIRENLAESTWSCC